jgi:hypothetical protein
MIRNAILVLKHTAITIALGLLLIVLTGAVGAMIIYTLMQLGR